MTRWRFLSINLRKLKPFSRTPVRIDFNKTFSFLLPERAFGDLVNFKFPVARALQADENQKRHGSEMRRRLCRSLGHVW